MWVFCRWVIFGLLAASSANAGNISGTYVGTGSNSAFLVQIVEATGGQLTGRYEQTVLRSDGTLDRATETITGASDGHTIVVTIKPPEFGSTGTPASGTLDGSTLHLTGGGGAKTIDLTLLAADEGNYRTLVAALSDRGRRIIEARAQADQLSRLSELVKSMLAYAVAVDAQLAKFPPIESRYRSISELMSNALARQRSIYGGGQASVARGQIDVAINQAANEAEQLHANMKDANRDIGAKTQSLVKSALEFNQICQASEPQSNADLRFACQRFSDAKGKFKQGIETLGRAFDEAERVWVTEHRRQQDIIHASNVASR